jgi:nickel superoxide dismutase
MNLVTLAAKVFPLQTVYAHCDIPCGIYTPNAALIAAETIVKMVDKIVNPPEFDEKNIDSKRNYHNNMSRYVLVKEEHARLCKGELLILWADFFKEEHLEKFPDLHETFWKAMKLCSKNKQEVNAEAAKELKATVEKIAKMFDAVNTNKVDQLPISVK